MNLPYLNKNISKCTIYIKQLDLREVYEKIITIENYYYIQIKNVLYVDGLKQNLLSIS